MFNIRRNQNLTQIPPNLSIALENINMVTIWLTNYYKLVTKLLQHINKMMTEW